MKALILAVDADKDLQEEDIKSADKHILWSINYDRFNREFRDQVRISNSVTRLDDFIIIGLLPSHLVTILLHKGLIILGYLCSRMQPLDNPYHKDLSEMLTHDLN